jgi:hypothetical protein
MKTGRLSFAVFSLAIMCLGLHALPPAVGDEPPVMVTAIKLVDRYDAFLVTCGLIERGASSRAAEENGKIFVDSLNLGGKVYEKAQGEGYADKQALERGGAAALVAGGRRRSRPLSENRTSFARAFPTWAEKQQGIRQKVANGDCLGVGTQFADEVDRLGCE